MTLVIKRINLFMGYGSKRSEIYKPVQALKAVQIGHKFMAERHSVKHQASGR